MNQLTHWMDGSSVYGSDQEEQNALRAKRNGLLKTSRGNMLPINPDQGGECEAELRDAECFLAGGGHDTDFLNYPLYSQH